MAILPTSYLERGRTWETRGHTNSRVEITGVDLDRALVHYVHLTGKREQGKMDMSAFVKSHQPVILPLL